MKILKKYFSLVQIWESDYGREYGWVIKKDGLAIAKLSDCIATEMSWGSYELETLTKEQAYIDRLRNPLFWENFPIDEFEIENAIINYKIDGFFCDLDQQSVRLNTRYLVVPIRHPTFFDYLLTRLLNAFFYKDSPSNFNQKNGYLNWFTDKRTSENIYRERERAYSNYLKETAPPEN